MKHTILRLVSLMTLAALLLLPVLTACGTAESEPAAQTGGSQTNGAADNASDAGTADRTDSADAPAD